MTYPVDTKITKIRVKNHLAYGMWKYMLLAIVAVFGWNLVYTTTAYRVPKDRKIDVYFVTPQIATETLELFEAESMTAYAGDETMEEVNFFSVAMNTEDDYYATLQLTTYIGAQEGDVFLMDKSRFKSYAEGSAFMDLSAALSDGRLDVQGIDVAGGYGVDMDGVRGLYGIPASSLYGLIDHNIDNRNLVIGVMAYTQNEDNAIKMVNWLIEQMQAERPDWLDALEAREKQNAVEQPLDYDLPSY